MHSPWEPAIPQAMQHHGGRNRPVVNKPAPEPLPATVDAPALVPESPAADSRPQGDN